MRYLTLYGALWQLPERGYKKLERAIKNNVEYNLIDFGGKMLTVEVKNLLQLERELQEEKSC